MVSKEEIDRLGFDAWANNVFVNLIEDFVESSGQGGEGNISINHKDYDINIEWDMREVVCTIRAYTSDGWKSYSNTCKR